MAVTPEERARYARRRYDIANRWWQTSPLGAAAQGGSASERSHTAGAPVRTGGRMGPNFAPSGARPMKLPTIQNRASGLAGWQRQIPLRTRLQSAYRGPNQPFMTQPWLNRPSGLTYAQQLPQTTAPNYGGRLATKFATRAEAFNRWRARDRAGRPV